MTRLRLVFGGLLGLMCASCCAENGVVVGTIAPSLPDYSFTAHFRGSDGAVEEGAGRMDSIEVRKGSKLVQTIQFGDNNDAPEDFGELHEIISLKDVDCDGYRDLLVRKTTGENGLNVWYYLYRFRADRGEFALYPGFEKLPFESVSCRTRTVHTFMKGGMAGCLYDEGYYRWAGGKLLPVRLEVQEATTLDSFLQRKVYVWQNGRRVLRSLKTYPMDDCHAGNAKVTALRK